MAIKKVQAPAKSTPATPKQKQAKSKVQASEKSPPQSPVLGAKVRPEDTVKLLGILFKNGSGEFDPANEDDAPMMAQCAAFMNAEGREPRSIDELLAWIDTPYVAAGSRKNASFTTPFGKFLRRNPLPEYPAAKGRVREAMQIANPGPRLRVEESSKLRRPAEGFSEVPDRVDSDGARMATKASSKPRQGKFGLTVEQCKEALKSCKGTPGRGYAQPINAMARSLFQQGTISVTAISSLKAAELNALVQACKAAGII